MHSQVSSPSPLSTVPNAHYPLAYDPIILMHRGGGGGFQKAKSNTLKEIENNNSTQVTYPPLNATRVCFETFF